LSCAGCDKAKIFEAQHAESQQTGSLPGPQRVAGKQQKN
jgi:hypothetical protein